MQTSKVNKKQSTLYKVSTVNSKLLVIDRDFNVPVEKLFDAFSHGEVIKVWWWPKDLYADKVNYDFKEGGKYFISMKGFDQGGGGMTGQFEEIVKNERIVMTDYFSDEKGNPISAAQADMPGQWPDTVYITFDFESFGEDKSRFKLSQQGIPNEMQKDCTQGWNESFDKLEKYLMSHKH